MSRSGAIETTGVTCRITVNGKNVYSTGRHWANSSASSAPPTVAEMSASKVIDRVTSSEPNRVPQSLTSV